MPPDLYLHQEVLLLALNDAKGTPVSGMHTYAMAGALVSELLLHERIIANDDRKKIVAVVNDKPIGEPVLDELLTMIAESKKNLGTQDWVFKAASIKDLHHRVAQSLCERGILQQDEKKILFLFTRKVYPELNSTVENAIRQRMANIMFDEKALPDERTAVLIALAKHGSLIQDNFAPVELKQHKQRIEELASGEVLAAGATKTAIQAVQAAAMTAAMIPAIVVATTSS